MLEDDKCDNCNFETLFVDQFKKHKKWNHLESKRKAEMEVNTSSGKRPMSVLSNKDKLHERPQHKALYRCKECSHEARDKYNLKRHMKKTWVN